MIIINKLKSNHSNQNLTEKAIIYKIYNPVSKLKGSCLQNFYRKKLFPEVLYTKNSRI